MSVLISTDNHLGFMERDPIRGSDSFLAFEEVLASARAQKVDMVLLAGDLFHENKPTRYTLWRTMEILRKYVMGYQPVRVQVLSDYSMARTLKRPGDADEKAAAAAAKAAMQNRAAAPAMRSVSRSVGRSSSRAPSTAAGGGGGGRGVAGSKRRRAETEEEENAEEDAYGQDEDLALLGVKPRAPSQKMSSSAAANKGDEDDDIGPAAAGGAAGRGSDFVRVNFEDPNYNVELPIFSIHGNHDDPVREGPTGEVLAALDILATANLINYFGKSESAGRVEVAPVLLAKGKTRLALYGLGNIRDDRLHRTLIEGNMKFRRPVGEPNDYFSLMLIHQNRDNRGLRQQSGTGMEAVLPGFLDLVIWGHEHECHTDLTAAQGRSDMERATRIMQPGSTIATSLCEGESRQKHVFKLDIRGTQFRTTATPLRCVRPFISHALVLSESDIDSASSEADKKVTLLLRGKIEAMIKQAAREFAAIPESEAPPETLRLPLLRLKVEHTGFRILSNQRFGAAFAGKVANPADLLLFHRKAIRPIGGLKGKKVASSAVDLEATDLPPILPGDLPGLRVEDIVDQELERGSIAGKGFKVIRSRKLATAVRHFIEGDPSAIKDAVEDTIEARKRETLSMNAVDAVAMGRDNARAAVSKLTKESVMREDQHGEEGGTSEDEKAKRKRQMALITGEGLVDTGESPASSKGGGGKGGRKGDDDEFEEDLDSDTSTMQKKKKAPAAAKAKKAPAKPRASKAKSKNAKSDDDDEDEDEVEVLPAKIQRGTGAASVSVASSTGRSQSYQRTLPFVPLK
jgi:double-strand break repair protein MRE11